MTKETFFKPQKTTTKGVFPMQKSPVVKKFRAVVVALLLTTAINYGISEVLESRTDVLSSQSILSARSGAGTTTVPIPPRP